MPVDRAIRALIVRDLAALMRGEISPSHFMDHTQAQCAQSQSARDFLVVSFWNDRLGPLPYDLRALSRLQVSAGKYEYLRRWAAILQTEVDWNVDYAPLDKPGCLTCLPLPLTIGAMIACGLVLDGVLIIAWTLIGAVAGPIALILLWHRSHEESTAASFDPFASIEDRDSVIHLAHAVGVPPYDPKRHGVPFHTTISRVLRCFPALIPWIAAMCALWPFTVWLLWNGDDEDRLERVPLPHTSVQGEWSTT